MERRRKQEKRRKPISQRMTFEVDGEKRRLGWIAENKPEFLIQQLLNYAFDSRYSALLSELARVGYDRPRIEKEAAEHPEWGVDPGLLGQL